MDNYLIFLKPSLEFQLPNSDWFKYFYLDKSYQARF